MILAAGCAWQQPVIVVGESTPLINPTRTGSTSNVGQAVIESSGSNDWKGSAFYFTRDDSLVGDGPDSLGEFGDFEDEEYGFRIGGPIDRPPLPILRQARRVCFLILATAIRGASSPAGDASAFLRA